MEHVAYGLDSEDSRLNQWHLEFSPLIPVGDEALLLDVLRGEAQGPRERYELAVRVANAVSWVVSGWAVSPPVYNLGTSEFTLTSGFARLVMLPGFRLPGRAFWFACTEDGKRLALIEYWVSCDPRFGPIDPGKFLADHKIPKTDDLALRQAVIALLKLRGAPRGDLFDERDE